LLPSAFQSSELHPPGRFLKRAPYALQEPILLSDGRYQLPPRGLEGPWEEVSDEKACAKATQVLRDIKLKGSKPDEKLIEEALHVPLAAGAAVADLVDDMNEEMPETSVMSGVNSNPLQDDAEGTEEEVSDCIQQV